MHSAVAIVDRAAAVELETAVTLYQALGVIQRCHVEQQIPPKDFATAVVQHTVGRKLQTFPGLQFAAAIIDTASVHLE
ncbi:hypothetical protein D3C80_2113170 [compost metagenome]